MTRLDRGAMQIEIPRKLRIVLQCYQFAVRSEWVDDAEPAPGDRTGKNVSGHDDWEVRDHVREKRVRVDHIDKASEMKFVGDEPAQRATVAVFDPAIRADEAQASAVSQQSQRLFDERHINVGAVVNGAEAPPV